MIDARIARTAHEDAFDEPVSQPSCMRCDGVVIKPTWHAEATFWRLAPAYVGCGAIPVSTTGRLLHGRRQRKGHPSWHKGTSHGHTAQNHEHIVCAPEGVIKVRTAERPAVHQQADLELHGPQCYENIPSKERCQNPNRICFQRCYNKCNHKGHIFCEQCLQQPRAGGDPGDNGLRAESQADGPPQGPVDVGAGASQCSWRPWLIGVIDVLLKATVLRSPGPSSAEAEARPSDPPLADSIEATEVGDDFQDVPRGPSELASVETTAKANAETIVAQPKSASAWQYGRGPRTACESGVQGNPSLLKGCPIQVSSPSYEMKTRSSESSIRGNSERTHEDVREGYSRVPEAQAASGSPAVAEEETGSQALKTLKLVTVYPNAPPLLVVEGMSVQQQAISPKSIARVNSPGTPSRRRVCDQCSNPADADVQAHHDRHAADVDDGIVVDYPDLVAEGGHRHESGRSECEMEKLCAKLLSGMESQAIVRNIGKVLSIGEVWDDFEAIPGEEKKYKCIEDICWVIRFDTAVGSSFIVQHEDVDTIDHLCREAHSIARVGLTASQPKWREREIRYLCSGLTFSDEQAERHHCGGAGRVFCVQGATAVAGRTCRG